MSDLIDTVLGQIVVGDCIVFCNRCGDRSSSRLILSSLKDAYCEQHLTDHERDTLQSMKNALFKKD